MILLHYSEQGYTFFTNLFSLEKFRVFLVPIMQVSL